MQTEKKKFRKKKRMRLPAKFGSVTTLSNPESRRRPYQAKKTVGYDEKGNPIYMNFGYFETWEEAFDVLYEYNKNPYDIEKDTITFEEVYERWYEYKFINTKKKYSNSTINCYKAGFKNSSPLHKKKWKTIKTLEMQAVIDNCGLRHASQEHIKNLFTAMYKYAVQFDLSDKNYAQFVQINIEDDDESGIPFTPDEIKAMWENIHAPFIDVILMLIYSGWRISEFLSLTDETINLKENFMTAGVKTDSGKDRIVPIHSAILPLIQKRMLASKYLVPDNRKNKRISDAKFRSNFNLALKDIGIPGKHTPHDCRHTFTTLLDDAKAEEHAIKLMLGHKITDITKGVYTHKDIAYLRCEIEKIKIPPVS